MTTRRRQYLYLYESLAISIPESQLGAGKTLTATICASQRGAAAAIGSLTTTATAVAASYDATFALSALVSQLGTNYLDATVYLHLTDSVAWRDVYEFVVTNVDPDLLPPLL